MPVALFPQLRRTSAKSPSFARSRPGDGSMSAQFITCTPHGFSPRALRKFHPSAPSWLTSRATSGRTATSSRLRPHELRPQPGKMMPEAKCGPLNLIPRRLCRLSFRQRRRAGSRAPHCLSERAFQTVTGAIAPGRAGLAGEFLPRRRAGDDGVAGDSQNPKAGRRRRSATAIRTGDSCILARTSSLRWAHASLH